MSNRFEAFDDVDENEVGGGGILQSAGLRDYDNISTRVVPEGVSVQLNCRRCNRTKRVIIEWPEVVVLANNSPGQPPILPPGWTFSRENNSPYVSLACTSCANPTGFAIHLPFNEAKQHLNNGIQNQVVPQQLVQQISQQIAQQRGFAPR